MTTDDNWHAPAEILERFLSNAVDPVTAASVEMHLVACTSCRKVLRALSDPHLAEASWDAIADRIDQPQASAVERLARRVGVRDGIARVVAATPALRLAGLTAIALVAVGAASASRVADAEGPFLLLAPIVPLVAVAATFARATDPAGETGLAAPLSGVGLLVRRAVVVLGVTFALLGIAAPFSAVGSAAAAWVLPALALTFAALAVATWLPVEASVGGLAAVWFAGVLTVRFLTGFGTAFADSAVFTATGQLVALATIAVAGAVLVVRRERFATLEVPR